MSFTHSFKSRHFISKFKSADNAIIAAPLFSKTSTSSSSKTNEGSVVTVAPSYEIKKEDHILCPPKLLQELALHESIHPVESLPDISIKRLSYDPNIFLFKNFLDCPSEQVGMIMAAVNQGMEYSGTNSGDVVSQRLNSYTSWIYPHEEESDEEEGGGRRIAKFMTDVTAHLFLPNHYSWNGDMIPEGECIAEPVQVVRYDVGGKYDIHHDGYNRFLTVLCYLNGIAG